MNGRPTLVATWRLFTGSPWGVDLQRFIQALVHVTALVVVEVLADVGDHRDIDLREGKYQPPAAPQVDYAKLVEAAREPVAGRITANALERVDRRGVGNLDWSTQLAGRLLADRGPSKSEPPSTSEVLAREELVLAAVHLLDRLANARVRSDALVLEAIHQGSEQLAILAELPKRLDRGQHPGQ